MNKCTCGDANISPLFYTPGCPVHDPNYGKVAGIPTHDIEFEEIRNDGSIPRPEEKPDFSSLLKKAMLSLSESEREEMIRRLKEDK